MLKFLADESCDFSIVKKLRSCGLDVKAVVEDMPGVPGFGAGQGTYPECAYDEACIGSRNQKAQIPLSGHWKCVAYFTHASGGKLALGTWRSRNA